MQPSDKLLEKDVAKQRISQDEATATRGRLTSTTSLDELSDVDFVIEAVPVRRQPNIYVPVVDAQITIGNSGSQDENILGPRAYCSFARDPRYKHVVYLHYQNRRCDHKKPQGPLRCVARH